MSPRRGVSDEWDQSGGWLDTGDRAEPRGWVVRTGRRLLTASDCPLLWPLTRYSPPTPGLYLSTEPGPTVVAAAGAIVVWLATRRRGSTVAARERR